MSHEDNFTSTVDAAAAHAAEHDIDDFDGPDAADLALDDAEWAAWCRGQVGAS